MKLSLLLAGIPLLGGVMARNPVKAPDSPMSALAHTDNEFSFVARASYEQVFPLFGAWEEKKWAYGWDPRFLFPAPPRDQLGMVFTVAHGGKQGVWTNTAFDEADGHVQYVYVIHDVLITLIDIHLTRAGVNETHVSVAYERTALSQEANDHVVHLAKGDARSGPEWAEAINGYLSRSGNGSAK